MRIAPEHIQEKALAGKLEDGSPVMYVMTKGGLHAFFVKKDDGIHSIGAAPHRGVAEWIAEKKHPDIEWDSKFKSKELEKSERVAFDRVRNLIFSPGVPGEPVDAQEMYFVYDAKAVTIDVMSKSEIASQADRLAWSFVRPVNLSEPVDFVRYKVWDEEESA